MSYFQWSKLKLSIRLSQRTVCRVLLHRKQEIGLLGGGLLMGLAPVNAWHLTWIAMVPLWWAVERAIPSTSIKTTKTVSCVQRLQKALIDAGLWGLAYHGVALSWVTGLHPITWLGFTWLESFLAIVIFAWIFITLWAMAIGMTWISLMVGLDRIIRQAGATKGMSAASRLLIGTALWCAVEWLWSQGPLYWSSLSYTQSPGNLWVLQLGQLSGPMTVTAAIVSVNGLLAEGWLRRTQIPARKIFWGGAIALFISLHLIGLSLYAQPLSDDPATAIKVGLIQGNIPNSRKLTSAGVQEATDVYLEGYERLVAAGAEIVVTPEGAIPRPWNSLLQSRRLLQQAVIKNGVPLVLGVLAHEDIDDIEAPLTQSLLTLAANGEVVGRYNKVKLVPLGEYLPLEKLLLPLIGNSPFGDSMVPGKLGQRLETPLGSFAAGICYESTFSHLFRQQVRDGGQLILTASNNDPYPPRQMAQHHAQDVMRAIETNRWEVRVTNTGISGVVDPKGRSQWLSKPNTRTTHLATVYQRQTQTLYVQIGNWLTPLLLILSAIALIVKSSTDK